MKKFTSLFLTCILFSVSVLSQPGTLDSTFSNDGKLKTQIGANGSWANAVAIQADGRIVVAGGCKLDRFWDHFTIVRYKTQGILDETFGVNGSVITDFKGYHSSVANSVAIQADGKIVAAGAGYTNNSSSTDFVLVRYMRDGTLDSAFGINGKVTTDFKGSGDLAYSIAIDAEGKIVVAGWSQSQVLYIDFALARYRMNGSLDSAFGVDGKVITDFGGFKDFGQSVTIQGGKILVAGFVSKDNYDTESEFAVARYHHNGKLDSSFGTNGKVTTAFGTNFHQLSRSIALQGGKIVVGGETYPYDFAMVRYHANGTIDKTFGSNGEVITDFGRRSDDYGRAIAIQADGQIIMAGRGNSNFALARYNKNGELDNRFGVNGLVSTDFGDQEDANAVAIQTDGKIVVVGYSHNNIAIARYNGDSTLAANTRNNNFSNLQKQNNTATSIHISPNPAKDILYVEGLSSSSKTISVLDVQGKLLQQITTTNTSYSFNVKQLAAGTYFIRIDEGEKDTALKFIKK